MVLVTGPTGSGKTNSLYSAINRIDTAEHQHHDGRRTRSNSTSRASTRSRSRSRSGSNFAAALRTSCAAAPNIILVGEIREFETAEIAVEAALTGAPRVLHPPHERRAVHHQPAHDGHGVEPFLFAATLEADRRAAAGPAHLQGLPGGDRRCPSRRSSTSGSARKRRRRSRCSAGGAAPTATTRVPRPRRPARGHGNQRRAPRTGLTGPRRSR